MKAFCTGISGCDKATYIDEALKVAKQHGKSVENFHLGELFLKEVKRRRKNFNILNILNVPPATRGDWVSTVFERVMKACPEHEHSVINTHAIFFWKKVFSRAINTQYVREYNPDIFITFIDNAESIKKRLDNNPQWKTQNLTTDEIDLWQNVEVEVTKMIADMMEKPHVVLPRQQPPDTVYKTLFLRGLPSVYVSFPMSNIKDEQLRRDIDLFVEELRTRFIVISPRAIELSNKYSHVMGQQTVHRDLHWFIGDTDITIVYYPVNVRSTGVDREVKEAFDNGKQVWMVDSKENSPFLRHYSHAIFPTKEKLFKFLDEGGYIKIKKDGLYHLPQDWKKRYRQFYT